MRTIACAGLAILALAGSARAQVRIGISVRGGGFSAQPLVVPSYPPYPAGSSASSDGRPAGPVVMAPDRRREVDKFVDSLPKVPPPDELAILRAPANPAPIAGLPAEPIPKKVVPRFLAPQKVLTKVDEAKQQLDDGRDAYATGEPGSAAERFRKSIALTPDDAEGHFLLAQSLYALGRYREAVVEIIDGMKRKPDWPAMEFDVRELYGRRPAEHALDLERLRDAVERNPDEPALTFLYGYELWFNGRKKEARPFLERASKGAVDPTPIKRFLN
jgi:tetratricopeptide (TPR) repeat protein